MQGSTWIKVWCIISEILVTITLTPNNLFLIRSTDLIFTILPSWLPVYGALMDETGDRGDRPGFKSCVAAPVSYPRLQCRWDPQGPSLFLCSAIFDYFLQSSFHHSMLHCCTGIMCFAWAPHGIVLFLVFNPGVCCPLHMFAQGWQRRMQYKPMWMALVSKGSQF